MNNGGRPKKEAARNMQYRLRINDEEAKMLIFLSNKQGLAKSDIIRKAIKMLYNLEKNGINLE